MKSSKRVLVTAVPAFLVGLAILIYLLGWARFPGHTLAAVVLAPALIWFWIRRIFPHMAA